MQFGYATPTISAEATARPTHLPRPFRLPPRLCYLAQLSRRQRLKPTGYRVSNPPTTSYPQSGAVSTEAGTSATLMHTTTTASLRALSLGIIGKQTRLYMESRATFPSQEPTRLIGWPQCVGDWGNLVQPSLLLYGTAGVGGSDDAGFVYGLGLESQLSHSTTGRIEYLGYDRDHGVGVIRAGLNFMLGP